MSLSRRAFLVRYGLVILVAGGAYGLSSGFRDWLREQIAADFGEDIAQSSDTEDFLNDYLALLQAQKSRQYDLALVYFRIKPDALPRVLGTEDEIRGHMLQYFLRSTTVIAAQETDQAYYYAGLFEPEKASCQNQLAAWILE